MAKIKVYLNENCHDCSVAFDVISWIKSLVPDLEISILDIKEAKLPEFVKGSDGPIYEISGFYLEGNPTPEQLRDILILLARQNAN